MRAIETRGSFRDMGRALGEALREEIRGCVALSRTDRALAAPGAAARLQTYMDVTRSIVPMLLEELEGVAEGAALPLQTVAAINMPLGYDHSLDGCSNVAFAAGPDGPVWGKNNDGNRPEPEQRLPIVCRKIVPDRGIPVVTFPFAGWLGFGDGMNAEGLAMGHSSVGSVFQQGNTHAQVRLWAHYGMLTCRTTREFAAHMASRPLRGKGYAWVVVDRAGDACSLEIACPLTQIRRGSHPAGHVQCVNYYQLPALREADRRNPEGKALALRRGDMLDAKLAEDGPFDLERMKALLRHHGDPGMCRHGGHDMSYTEYSMIGLPQSGRVLYAHGNPCEAEYAELTV